MPIASCLLIIIWSYRRIEIESPLAHTCRDVAKPGIRALGFVVGCVALGEKRFRPLYMCPCHIFEPGVLES